MSHGLKGDFLLVYNKFQNPILERKEIISLDHLSAHIYFWEFIIGSEYIKLDWKKLKIGEIKIVKNYQNSPKIAKNRRKWKLQNYFSWLPKSFALIKLWVIVQKWNSSDWGKCLQDIAFWKIANFVPNLSSWIWIDFCHKNGREQVE